VRNILILQIFFWKHFFFGSRIAPIFIDNMSKDGLGWSYWNIMFIFEIMIQKTRVKNFKSTSNDLKFSHAFRMSKTNIRTKLDLILTIFEKFIELRNFGIFKYHSYCFIKPIIFSFEFQNSNSLKKYIFYTWSKKFWKLIITILVYKRFKLLFFRFSHCYIF